MTSYQKLKKENEQLKKDLAIMVFYSGSIAAIGVESRYRLKRDFIEHVFTDDDGISWRKGGVIPKGFLHKLSPVMRTTADGVNNFLYGRTSMPEKKAKYADNIKDSPAYDGKYHKRFLSETHGIQLRYPNDPDQVKVRSALK